MRTQTTLSVLVPVYNEQYLVAESLSRLERIASHPSIRWMQVVVVDDASRDESSKVLKAFAKARRHRGVRWKFLRHDRNQGKGAAIRTALAQAEGEITLIHDADLEYHPEDIPGLLKPFLEDGADAVFGSRFQPRDYRRVLNFRHELGNRFLTFLCNWFSNLNLTDMETCYKAVRTPLLKSIPLVSDDFRLEPELTLKLAKRRARVYEVPINYSGRSYAEGKKIGWRDGFRALGAILRFAWSDFVYADDTYNSRIFARLERAPRYNAWLASRIRPWLGQHVLQFDAATGLLAEALMPRRRWTAVERNPYYLERLQGLTRTRPYFGALAPSSLGKAHAGYDTVLSVNGLAYADDAAAELARWAARLAPGGRLVLVLPASPLLQGSLDSVLGHQRRFSHRDCGALAAKAGLQVEHLQGFNRLGGLAWWVNAVILRRRSFPKLQILFLNLISPWLGLLDHLIPFLPQNRLLVLRKPGGPK